MTAPRVAAHTDTGQPTLTESSAGYSGMTADEVADEAQRHLRQAERIAREATETGWHLTDPPRLTATTPYCPPSHCYCLVEIPPKAVGAR